MVKLIVISDSHGNKNAVQQVLDREKGVDAVLFLGDGLTEMYALIPHYPGCRFYMVRGNCDYSCADPAEGLCGFEGLLVFYTHGNGYDVKLTPAALKSAARQRGADIALFGHTHSPYYEYTDGLYLFNPGSISQPRTGFATYGVITIDEGTPRFTHVKLERQ